VFRDEAERLERRLLGEQEQPSEAELSTNFLPSELTSDDRG
jgi:hypothetical protein